MMNILLFMAILACLVPCSDSFLASPPHLSQRTAISSLFVVARYGPPPSTPSSDSNNGTRGENDDSNKHEHPYVQKQQDDFRALVQQVMSVSKPEHLPRLLANNMPLIMKLQGDAGTRVISHILEEATDKKHTQQVYDQTLQGIETILTFAEDFVHEAKAMDDHNKQVLGKIIKAMANKNNEKESRSSVISREEALDLLLEGEKENFTPGFLRHIEGECERITNAPKMTRESARLLEILRVVQTRVLEELGKEMGESAVVLGQLLGYEDKKELLGVLDAGLTVRGEEFAKEMAQNTREALEGFTRVPGGVDPELVERVTFIDNRLKEFLGQTAKGFQ